MRYDHQLRETGFHSAIMTTFSFDPIGFENVILTTLKSAQCRNIAVLGDARMINQAMADLGPPSFAGQNYHLAKRSLNACFHPKIVAQFGTQKGRLLIGSSNLTTAGINGNLEAFGVVVRNEDNKDTAGLFKTVLDYIWRHTAPGDIGMKRTIEQVYHLSPWLKEVDPINVVEVESGSRLGVFTEAEDASIADQLLAEISDDVVSELIVVSPYWDDGLEGLNQLREALGGPNTRIIPELAEQDFPQQAVKGDLMLKVMSPEALTSGDGRRLHSKMIICKSSTADYVLTGSMNASRAGLWGRGEFGGNAEAAVFRKIVDRSSIQIVSNELERALETPFPADRFCVRLRKGAEGGETSSSLRDGGLLQIRNGQITWLPPARYDDAKGIILHDNMGGEIAEITPKPQKPLAISDEIAGKVRFGQVSFDDGTMSAPVVVAVLSQLERAGEPPQSLRTRRIIEELKSKRDIRDIFEMIGRLDALQHEEMQTKREKTNSGSGPRKKKDSSHDETNLDEGDFYEFDGENSELEREFGQATTLSELRRAINRVVGHGEALWADPNEILEMHDQNLASTEELGNTEEDHVQPPDGGDPPVEKKETPVSKRVVISTKTPGAEARQFIDDLRSRSVDLQKLVALQAPGEIQLDQALLFQVIVYATFTVSSQDEPSESYPLPAFERTSETCWIRILARFLMPHCRSWYSDNLMNSELESYQLEALATLSVACQVVIASFSRRDDIPEQISKPFERAAGRFLKTVAGLSGTNPLAGERLATLNDQIFASQDVLRLIGAA